MSNSQLFSLHQRLATSDGSIDCFIIVSKPSRPTWHKVLWWLGIAVSFNLALYFLIPKFASFFVERQMKAFGLRNVHVEFEYPGLQQSSIPLIAFQKDMGTETATLTIRNLTLEYYLPQLFAGFLNEVRIEELHLDITGVPSEQPQSITSTSAVKSVGTSLPFLSKPLPDPPFGLFSLTKGTIFREQGDGCVRGCPGRQDEEGARNLDHEGHSRRPQAPS